jgi:predicted DNA-binding transcriptional regulator YafY
MAEQETRDVLIRQWCLVDLLRSSPQGRSIQSLMEELKVSEATLDSDLSVLEEAEFPIERLKIFDEPHVLYDDDMRFPPAVPPNPSSVMAILNEAIKQEFEVHLSYTLPRTSWARSFQLAPFLVDEISGVPYLLAWDMKTEGWRLFEVARITRVKWSFNHNQYRDEKYIEKLFNELAGKLGELIPVVVRLTPLGAHLVSDYPLTPTQVVETLPDGGYIIRCQKVGFWDALYWVLGWGPEIEVLEPVHLREKAASKQRRALHNYLDKKISEMTAERALLARGLPSY